MQGQVVLQGEIVAAEAPPQQYAMPQQPYATAQPVYGQPQPVYSQPAPVVLPPAAPQTVQVQIPAGMMPGSVFDVQANGQRIRVTVPAGGTAGQLLNVRVPPRAPIVVQQVAGRAPPRGAPAGGIWCQRPFCGPITILIAIFLVPCVCCCPCDQREMYVVNGVEYLPSGAVEEKCCCDCS